MIDPIQAQRAAAGGVMPHEPAPVRSKGETATERHADHTVASGNPAHAPAVVTGGARVTFSVDAQLRETIIKVVDPESGKVIRQIPQESRLRMQRAYQEEQAKLEQNTAQAEQPEKSEVA